MSFNWHDTIDESTDWTAVDFQQTFFNAVYERCWAANCSWSDSGLYDAKALAAGMDATWIINWLQYNLVGYGQAADGCAKRYLNPNKTLDGNSTFTFSNYNSYTAASLDDYLFLGCPVIGGVTQPAVVFSLIPGMNPAGFTRKYPREVYTAWVSNYLTTKSLSYQNAIGNTLTVTVYSRSADPVGAKARLVNNSGDTGLAKLDGRIFIYDGTQWSLSTDANDVYPDLVTAYGRIQQGDYIGPWIWNEIRSVVNLLTKAVMQTGWGYGTEGRYEYDHGYGNTIDAAYSALYLYRYSTNSGQLYPSKSTTVSQYMANNAYYANLMADFHVVLSSNPAFSFINGGNSGTPCPSHMRLYIRPTYVPNSSGVRPANYVFNDFGDGLTENTWKCYQEFDFPAGSSSFSLTYGGFAAKPPLSSFWPTVPTSGGSGIEGYSLDSAIFGVFDYGITSGFQYQAAAV